MIYFYYPPTVLGFLLFLALFLYLFYVVRGTKEERQARRQERLEANRAKIQENMQAMKESYRKIRIEDKIAILSVIVVFVLAALALWFFLG
ncbi:MAG: hypothetical protein Q4A17_04760 [Thermoguttaceae bacterium]|nr:hypothetical protein [Thermoguttaceae bacterium]